MANEFNSYFNNIAHSLAEYIHLQHPFISI